MAKSEKVLIQPTTSYLDGAEHKHAYSEPYEVERPHAVELTANGFARMLDGTAYGEEPAAQTEAVEDGRIAVSTETKIENDGKPRGRRGSDRV